MFGVLFWLARYPFTDTWGRKPARDSRCMEVMTRRSAPEALTLRLCSRARATAPSMVSEASIRGRVSPATAAGGAGARAAARKTTANTKDHRWARFTMSATRGVVIGVGTGILTLLRG